jgi:hypothetical protein
VETAVPTPLDVALVLRQEAGFGCCKCGFPIIQYHHIVPLSVEEHFRPGDMMALCPNCHDEVTNGRGPEADQRSWKANPFNIVNGHPGGRLRVNQQTPLLIAGSMLIEDCPRILVIGRETIMSMKVEDSRLLISLRLYDQSDKLLLEIVDNEWIFGDSRPWDFESKWNFLKLRQAERRVHLELDTRKEPVRIKGKFWKNGHSHVLGNKNILVDGKIRLIGDARHCNVAIMIQD